MIYYIIEVKMNWSALNNHINAVLDGSENADKVYVVYGVDDYLVYTALKQFRRLVDDEFAQFNFARFSQADGMAAVLETLNTVPVFDVRKVAVLTLSEKCTEAELSVLKDYLASPNEGTVLAIGCPADVAKSLGTKHCTTVNCAPLSEQEINEQIDALLKEPPARTMDAAARKELIERTQSSMARIVTETAKLKAFSDGNITYKDVTELVNADLDYRLYMLTDAVSVRDSARTVDILTAMLDAGTPPRVIINGLYDRFRKLLHVSLNKGATNDYFASYFGGSPNALYFIRRTLANYTQIRLKNSVDMLHRLQYDILSGKRQEDSAMHEAVLELININ